MPDQQDLEVGEDGFEESYGFSGLLGGFSRSIMAGIVGLSLTLTGCASLGTKEAPPDIEPAEEIRLLEGSDKSIEEKEEKLEERYDLELDAWGDNYFKNNPEVLSAIASVLHKEHTEKEFDIPQINIVDDIIWNPLYIGSYTTSGLLEGTIYIEKSEEGFRKGILHHEIIHAKYDEIREEYPEIEEKWKDLARDEDGDLFYNYQDLEDHKEKGFFTLYATTDIWEDTADHGEEAEVNPEELYTAAKSNNRIMKKIKLADNPMKNWIPESFLEYHRLKRLYQKTQATLNLGGSTDYFDHFIEESKSFLVSNHGVYQGHVRNARGELLKELSEDIGNEEKMLENAANEFRKCLQADYKKPEIYKDALQNLAELHHSVGNISTSSIYLEALERYEEMREAGNVSLTTKGVVKFPGSEN